MKKTHALAALAVAAAAGVTAVRADDVPGLVAHEWGTFTQLSGSDGVAIDFRPLEGVSDLPSFVYASTDGPRGLRNALPQTKSAVSGTVRMETPVIYFYAPPGSPEQKVGVRVSFPQGRITEYYPRARAFDGTTLDWGTFAVLPGAHPDLPTEARPSHYYAARATDADPVRVCDPQDGLEHEKFLFYRGVGSFPLPLEARLAGDTVSIAAPGSAAVGQAFVFERHGDDVRFSPFCRAHGLGHCREHARCAARDRSKLPRATVEQVQEQLRSFLVEQGLFEKEARAMVETWKDSWFEDGLRVFYAVPRALTDAVLPLSIAPAPTKLVRVLVGRAELVTPEMEREVLEAARVLDSDACKPASAARETLRRYGRFARPILERALAAAKDESERARLRAVLGGC